jgi:2-polyprenyl-3-methyl-5-hydroxy-6-metoxy-1,4-benzoquinol methylase
METPPVKIGQEQFFTELISDLVLPEIRQKLEGFNIQSILDIGCGQGNTLLIRP